MKRPTQRETNPFPFSDANKRYHTFDYYLKRKYGGKCAVIPLDAGFTCPNIDGTKGTGREDKSSTEVVPCFATALR